MVKDHEEDHDGGDGHNESHSDEIVEFTGEIRGFKMAARGSFAVSASMLSAIVALFVWADPTKLAGPLVLLGTVFGGALFSWMMHNRVADARKELVRALREIDRKALVNKRLKALKKPMSSKEITAVRPAPELDAPKEQRRLPEGKNDKAKREQQGKGKGGRGKMIDAVVIAWAAGIVGALVLAGVQYVYIRDAHENRCYSSRFEMFAVRDQLVWLVASGEMSEDNSTWAAAYRTANALLTFGQEMNALSIYLDQRDYAKSLESDAREAARVQDIDTRLNQEARRVPGFMQALEDMNVAAWHIVDCRTSLRHHIGVLAVRTLDALVSIGSGVAKIPRTGAALVGWQDPIERKRSRLHSHA